MNLDFSSEALMATVEGFLATETDLLTLNLFLFSKTEVFAEVKGIVMTLQFLILYLGREVPMV